MKAVSQAISSLSQEEIAQFEKNNQFEIELEGEKLVLDRSDVEISSEDIPGWLVANDGKYTVALDISISEELLMEGIAREVVNRIQNFRKEAGFDVTDKIKVKIQSHAQLDVAITNNKGYICAEILASSLNIVNQLDNKKYKIELDNEVETYVSLEKE